MIAGLAKSSTYVLVVNILGIAASFLLQILTANVLGVASFGIYVFLLTVVNFLVMPIKSGFDISAIKFIPQFLSLNKSDSISNFKSLSVLNVIAFASLSLCIIFLLNYYKFIGIEYRYVVVMAGFLAGFQLYCSFIRAYGGAVYSQFLQNVLRPGLLLIFVWLLSTTSYDVSVNSVLLLQLFVLLIVFLFSYMYLNREANINKNLYLKKCEVKEWYSTSYSLLTVAIFNLIINQVDLIVVNYYTQPEDVGIYAACLRVATLIQFPIVAISLVLAPVFSSLYASGKLKKLERLVVRASMYSFLVSVPIFIFVTYFGIYILGLFGEDFKSGSDVLNILIIGKVIGAVGGFSGYLMTMTGHHKTAFKVLGVSALLCVFLNISFVSTFGVYGAAYANIISTASWVTLMSYYVGRKVRVAPLFLWRRYQ